MTSPASATDAGRLAADCAEALLGSLLETWPGAGMIRAPFVAALGQALTAMHAAASSLARRPPTFKEWLEAMAGLPQNSVSAGVLAQHVAHRLFAVVQPATRPTTSAARPAAAAAVPAVP